MAESICQRQECAYARYCKKSSIRGEVNLNEFHDLFKAAECVPGFARGIQLGWPYDWRDLERIIHKEQESKRFQQCFRA